MKITIESLSIEVNDALAAAAFGAVFGAVTRSNAASAVMDVSDYDEPVEGYESYDYGEDADVDEDEDVDDDDAVVVRVQRRRPAGPDDRVAPDQDYVAPVPEHIAGISERPEPDDAERDVTVGRDALAELVRVWATGYAAPVNEDGSSTVPQPDRMKAMQASMAAYGNAVFRFINHQGDLRAAVAAVFDESQLPEGRESREYTDDIAGNMVQIASIVTPPLAETIRYTHIDSRG